MDYYNIIVNWLKEQWNALTFEHVLYLIAFSFILSYITEYVLKFKQIRWLYYSIFFILFIKLIQGGHPIGAGETFYKLLII